MASRRLPVRPARPADAYADPDRFGVRLSDQVHAAQLLFHSQIRRPATSLGFGHQHYELSGLRFTPYERSHRCGLLPLS